MEDNKSKGKKGVLIAIVVCVVLIILLACLVLFYKKIDSTTFKLFVDGKRVSCSKDFYIEDQDGNMYIKARELASLIGWTYQNGEYGLYTEDTDSGYVQNEYEASSFVVNSKTLSKYIIAETKNDEENGNSNNNNNSNDEQEKNEIIVNSQTGSLETTTLDLPIISLNNQIYFPLANVNDICNCMATYQDYKMNIYEMNYLSELALQKAAEYGYTSVSGTYENLRALAYGAMIVNQNGKYGVVTLNKNKQLIGLKYNDMVFCQNVKEFFVKAEDTIGIISMDGKVVISPKNYDNISVLNDSLGLYLIEKDGLYGVLNREGDVVVYAEYDSIGLPEELIKEFECNNKYLLYDNTIIVTANEKYGLFNLDGKNSLSVSYEALGCINEEEPDKKSVLTIEAEIELEDGKSGVVKGIVVEKIDLNGESAYGVYDTIQERLIIPCGCSKIYSTTKNGETTYYMEFEGEEFEFNSYIEEQELYTVQ